MIGVDFISNGVGQAFWTRLNSSFIVFYPNEAHPRVLKSPCHQTDVIQHFLINCWSRFFIFLPIYLTLHLSYFLFLWYRQRRHQAVINSYSFKMCHRTKTRRNNYHPCWFHSPWAWIRCLGLFGLVLQYPKLVCLDPLEIWD